MKNLVYAIIIVIISIGAGYVLRYCTEPGLPTEVPPNDTTVVTGTTVLTVHDTVYIAKWYKVPAVTTIDSAGMVTKSIEKDTTVYSNQDTINIKVKAEYIPEEDLFNLAMDIEHKDYSSFRVDTMKVTEYYPVEVKVSDPTWILIAAGEFIVILGGIALIIFGG